MKARFSGKIKNSRSIPLILVLLAGLALGTFAQAAAQQQAEQAQPVSQAPDVPAQQTAVPEAAPATQQAPATTEQPAAQAAPNLEAAGPSCPPEYVPLIQKTTTALLARDFTFSPVKALNPFVPFITPEIAAGRLTGRGRAETGKRQASYPSAKDDRG